MQPSIKPIQKIIFLNNKGGVGKTTISFNIACKIADMGYKTLLIDADPQCNLTLLALGAMKYEELGLFSHDTIYTVFQPLIE
jgi:cellulose biosynthesis protein BcsQ